MSLHSYYSVFWFLCLALRLVGKAKQSERASERAEESANARILYFYAGEFNPTSACIQMKRSMYSRIDKSSQMEWKIRQPNGKQAEQNRERERDKASCYRTEMREGKKSTRENARFTNSPTHQ